MNYGDYNGDDLADIEPCEFHGMELIDIEFEDVVEEN